MRTGVMVASHILISYTSASSNSRALEAALDDFMCRRAAIGRLVRY